MGAKVASKLRLEQLEVAVLATVAYHCTNEVFAECLRLTQLMIGPSIAQWGQCVSSTSAYTYAV